MTKNSLSHIQLHLQEQSYPELTAMPGTEVTSEELPDLYKNMTLYELKEARLTRFDEKLGPTINYIKIHLFYSNPL